AEGIGHPLSGSFDPKSAVDLGRAVAGAGLSEERVAPHSRGQLEKRLELCWASHSHGRMRSGSGATGGAAVFAIRCPIRMDARKMEPIGIRPPSRCAAMAARPMDATQPQEPQSGLPPN